MEKERALFIKSYSNVPESLKKDIIALVDNKPYSWDSAYLEIKKNSELGKKILKSLKETGLL